MLSNGLARRGVLLGGMAEAWYWKEQQRKAVGMRRIARRWRHFEMIGEGFASECVESARVGQDLPRIETDWKRSAPKRAEREDEK